MLRHCIVRVRGDNSNPSKRPHGVSPIKDYYAFREGITRGSFSREAHKMHDLFLLVACPGAFAVAACLEKPSTIKSDVGANTKSVFRIQIPDERSKFLT
jgi:hypothetical protein